MGIEPTKGTILWRFAIGNKYGATGANPVWAEDLLFMSAAYGGGSAALEITSKGDKWNVRDLWPKNKKNLEALFATPIVADGYVYACHGALEAFTIKCLEL